MTLILYHYCNVYYALYTVGIYHLTNLLYLCLTWTSSWILSLSLSSIRVVVTVEQTKEEIEKAASCIREAALATFKWLQMPPAWRQTLKSTITRLSSCSPSPILCLVLLQPWSLELQTSVRHGTFSVSCIMRSELMVAAFCFIINLSKTLFCILVSHWNECRSSIHQIYLCSIWYFEWKLQWFKLQ